MQLIVGKELLLSIACCQLPVTNAKLVHSNQTNILGVTQRDIIFCQPGLWSLFWLRFLNFAKKGSESIPRKWTCLDFQKFHQFSELSPFRSPATRISVVIAVKVVNVLVLLFYNSITQETSAKVENIKYINVFRTFVIWVEHLWFSCILHKQTLLFWIFYILKVLNIF